MARFLDFLSRQPKPWLQKVHLDAQPERPLLQRLISRLPTRRPGERYAFGATPHAFLAGQPQHPPLSGSLWQGPLISNTCWLSRPPLAALAAPSKSLFGEMDSQRLPGAVASVLILALCLAYLLSTGPEQPTSAEEPAIAETPAEQPEAPAVAESATETDEALLAGGEPMPAALPLTPEQEAEVAGPSAEAAAKAPAGEPVKTKTPTDSQAMTASAESGPEQAPAPAESEAQPEPAKAAQAEVAPAPPRPVKKSAGKEKAASPEKAPQKPVYFSEQRSLAILTEARYLYLRGEGPLAVERLALAISGGHVHPDHLPAFNKMQADIESLLARFEAVEAAENKAEPAAQFLALEEEVFPGKVSAYEEQLPAPVAEESAAEATAEPEPEPAASTPQKGLQPPDPEEGEDRPH